MYGKGIYFSSKEIPSYGEPIPVTLLPHKQLYIEKDIDVPKVIGNLGLNYSDDKLPEKMVALGIGSMVFPVDNEFYTVVFDPKIVDIGNDKAKQNSTYLDDVASFIKLNYNCPASEKNSSERPCSDSLPSANKYPTKSENNKNYINAVKHTEDVIESIAARLKHNTDAKAWVITLPFRL